MVSRPRDQPWKPTRAQLVAAHGKTVPDVIAPDLKVLFCGINPGLYSAAVRHHFARPGNRFWPVLHQAGFCDRLLSPFEERELLRWSCGITNLVARATASAAELTDEEIRTGAHRLLQNVCRYRPERVAILGIGAARWALDCPHARLGRQEVRAGGAELWVLPNPSGLNAHYQLPDLVRLFQALRRP